MLALPFLTRGPLLTAHDDADPSRVYVALTRPRVARRSDGSSLARLVRWVRAARPDETTGARLSLDIEIDPNAAEIAALDVAPAQVAMMPWSATTIRLDGPGFDPVEAPVARALAGRGVVAVDLTADAAALLASLLTGETVSPLQVTWRGAVPVRLPAVEVIATADITEVKRRVTMIGPHSQRTAVRQIIDGHAHIEIRNAGNLELEQALRDWVLDELASLLAQGKGLSVRASAADVVMWPVELSTTLDDLIPPAHRGSVVETVVLDESDLGRTPPIEVRVFADFDALERVDVRLTAGAVSKELVFTTATPQQVALGSVTAEWSHRVKRRGATVEAWSAPAPLGSASSLVVSVAALATRRIDVFGAGLDFQGRWASVAVALSSLDGASVVGARTIELTQSVPSGHWIIPAGPAARLTAKLTYLSQLGQAIEHTIDPIDGDHVLVRDPLAGDGLRVTLLPAGTGWDDVAVAMVDVRYVDGEHTVDQAFELRKLTDLAEWTVPARPDGPGTIDWRLHASHHDGRFESSAWQSAAAGVVIVRIDGAPRRRVQILPVYFDPAATRSATVRLRSGAHSESVVVADRTAKSVTLPAGPLSWTVQWTAADGTQLGESPSTEGDDVIVLPRFTPS